MLCEVSQKYIFMPLGISVADFCFVFRQQWLLHEDLHKMQITTAVKTCFYIGFYWLLKAGFQSIAGEVLLAGATSHAAGFFLEE